eukprot:TRINITY_DN13543_c0_g7_i4.p1 TRINITY_DN13543_c0_g7~~TRINITY_DN13543_c0_g7_i4.p1  ORF type:complete len:448 (-),score=78.54 TRINITY_DN13543_c0_g7_i4:42-1385(-)
MRDYCLGIDIGTSKVAIVLCSSPSNIIEVRSQPHNATAKATSTRLEQDPHDMLNVCYSLIKSLPAELRERTGGIGITGQMHGIVLVDSKFCPVTNLINWQDRRCSEIPGLLHSISEKTKYKLSDGFGFATLLWFLHTRTLPAGACYGTTVQDLLALKLTGNKELLIDTSMAASWGFFNTKVQEWDYEAIKLAGIDLNMLPKVMPCGGVAGELSLEAAKEFGIASGALVMLPVGDNQASLMATIKHVKSEIALTLGTSSQVSLISDCPIEMQGVTFENRPYAFKKTAVVAAAMCGGNAWEWLAKFITKVVSSVGLEEPPIEKIYELMNDEGLKAKDELIIKPNFHGERYNEELKGIIEGITLENMNVGTLSRGLARGLVRNLKDMLPKEMWKNRTIVVSSGNALRRIPLLRKMVEEEFGLPLEILDSKEETATGAAINAYNGLNKVSP